MIQYIPEYTKEEINKSWKRANDLYNDIKRWKGAVDRDENFSKILYFPCDIRMSIGDEMVFYKWKRDGLQFIIDWGNSGINGEKYEIIEPIPNLFSIIRIK